MELPKAKIKISVTGEQTREIVTTTVGEPVKLLASWGWITLGIFSEKMTRT